MEVEALARYVELRTSGMTRDDAADKVGYSVRHLSHAQRLAERYGIGAIPYMSGNAHDINCMWHGISRPELIDTLLNKR